MTNIFASYINLDDAERAAGALIDQGARKEDISIIANEKYAGERSDQAVADATHAESKAKEGFSTTTAADAGMGAAKGLSVGVGVGILAGFAALTIPGFGLVIGGAALTTAVAGGLGTAAAGTIAGGVVGYLRDQGMGDDIITHYSRTFDDGGAILGLTIPTGTLDDGMAESLMVKYGALNVESVNTTSGSLRGGNVPPIVDPYRIADAPIPISAVRATRIDPITGEPLEGVVTDPITGIDRQVRIEDHQVIYMS